MTSKVLHRKTRTGSILKIVREHYLRADIPCGIEDCKKCEDIRRKNPPLVCVEHGPRTGLSSKFPQNHILIPDAATIVQQIDVLEDNSFGNNVIILQSVLADVRAKNLTLFNRMKRLIKDDGRRFYVFCNEFHKDTYKTRGDKETTEEYANKLVLVAAKWYQNHLNKIEVIVLSNNAFSGHSICFRKMSDYVSSLINNVDLVDKLLSDEAGEELMQKDNKFFFPDHLPISRLQGGLKKGEFYQGKYETSRNNYFEGSIPATLGNDEKTRILIQGREHINRAVNGDVVVVELLPESQWTGSSDVVVTPDVDAEKSTSAGKGDVDAEPARNSIKRPSGRVVGIIKRNWRQYCGTLKLRDKDMAKNLVLTSHLFIPSHKQIPIIKIETRQYDALVGQRIVVAIDSWPRNSMYPKGHYVRALGNIGDKDTERELILLEHDVPYQSFTPGVMKCLPLDPDNWKISAEEFEKRLDLRTYTVCSVDPPGCTDIDDALHCRDLGDNLYEIGVHIADVSHFVKSGTELDKEAASRGTTVYLVDQRIDMIPTVLSSNLCSLIEGRERLTFSVIWTMDATTSEIKGIKFTKSIIKSKAAMTYAEAQLRIDSIHDKSDIASSLRRLNAMAKVLRNKRIENGALVLANGGEIRFVEVESETHDNITQIESKQLTDTNSMIEEFMLLANISVAQKIYDDFPELALLRRHDKASEERFETLITAAKSRGLDMDVSSGKTLAESLNKAIDLNDPYFNVMIRMITTRCMNRAEYFCSGSVSSDDINFRHFGIAAPIYTHFTSPIRRYADLAVHRLLSFAIGASNLGTAIRKESTEKLVENINYRHKNAQEASRDSSRLHTLLFVKNSKTVIEVPAYVLDLNQNCLDLFMPRLALQMKYFLNEESVWSHDKDLRTQTYLPLKLTLRQFDKLTVQLGVVDKSTDIKRGYEQVETLIVEPPIDKKLKTQ